MLIPGLGCMASFTQVPPSGEGSRVFLAGWCCEPGPRPEPALAAVLRKLGTELPALHLARGFALKPNALSMRATRGYAWWRKGKGTGHRQMQKEEQSLRQCRRVGVRQNTERKQPLDINGEKPQCQRWSNTPVGSPE